MTGALSLDCQRRGRWEGILGWVEVKVYRMIRGEKEFGVASDRRREWAGQQTGTGAHGGRWGSGKVGRCNWRPAVIGAAEAQRWGRQREQEMRREGFGCGLGRIGLTRLLGSQATAYGTAALLLLSSVPWPPLLWTHRYGSCWPSRAARAARGFCAVALWRWAAPSLSWADPPASLPSRFQPIRAL